MTPFIRPRPARRAPAPARQRGATLIEILITMLIVTFGMLALAGFVVKASAAGIDASQRARALALLEDMAQRVANDRANADSYVTNETFGAASKNCGTATGATLELCTWNNLLVGNNDKLTSGTSAITYRGCVTKPYVGAPVYVVTVAWGTQVAGTPPADTCGQNVWDADDKLRRTVRTQVRVGTLAG